MNNRFNGVVIGVAVLAGVMLLADAAAAQSLPAPLAVTGKELSNDGDLDTNGSADPLQNLRWFGNGTTQDAFDYSGSGPPPLDPDQVDALANTYDYLFAELLANQATMVLSFKNRNDIHYHTPAQQTGIWATAAQVSTSPPLLDVDALELWTAAEGQAPVGGGDDARHYSYIGDPIPPNPPGNVPPISVFYYEPGAHQSFTYIPFAEVKTILAALLNITPPLLDFFEPDIDAMMIRDFEGAQPVAGDGFIPTWDNGDEIIFSVRPDATFGLDGGELFYWIRGGPISYLNYGGRIWDTANPVAQIFGVATEDINALEAIIPEPTAVTLMGLGILGVIMRRRPRV